MFYEPPILIPTQIPSAIQQSTETIQNIGLFISRINFQQVTQTENNKTDPITESQLRVIVSDFISAIKSNGMLDLVP